MFQYEYKDLFQSSLSDISLKDTLQGNLMQFTRAAEERSQEDKPSSRFMRILDVLNQSDPSFPERRGAGESKGKRPVGHSQRVKGRTMIILPSNNPPKCQGKGPAGQ